MKCTKKKFMGMSLSQWSPQSDLLHPAHHGEKFSTTNPNLERFTNIFGSNLSMEKQFLELDVDPATLLCVDPYEVNPIIVEKNMLPSTTLSVDIPLKVDAGFTKRNSNLPCGGGFYGPQRKIKLEMEEFSDLSSYLPKPMLTNSVDELNTPIFDKDAFNFNVYISQKDTQSEESFIKLESDVYYGNARITTDNSPFKNFSLNTEKVQRNENITSEVANLQNSDINQYSPRSENLSAYTCTTLPSYNTNTNVYIVDDKSALSVNSRHVSNVSSSKEQLWQHENILETPEDSNSSTSTEKQTKLSLDINFKSVNHENLDTPTIIQEVVDFESNFNILDLVGNEEISYVSSEDIFVTPSSVSSSVAESNEAVSEQTSNVIPRKRPRKKRTHSDDDEDYVPPSKKNVLQRRNVFRKASESESESDIEIETTPKSRPRGRPPKRTVSISSDCSKDSDVSKYRELRDKNNEASRKSRLKRKIKEIGLEKEADELICKNIKLKAQVEELEKMVNNFRDNLFKLMIRK